MNFLIAPIAVGVIAAVLGAVIGIVDRIVRYKW